MSTVPVCTVNMTLIILATSESGCTNNNIIVIITPQCYIIETTS